MAKSKGVGGEDRYAQMKSLAEAGQRPRTQAVDRTSTLGVLDRKPVPKIEHGRSGGKIETHEREIEDQA
jgi:hypothetical protein